MKKFVSLLLVFLLSLSFAACVERTPNPSGETIDLEIFVSSSEVSSRSDDAYVREKIQEAFYEDRGNQSQPECSGTLRVRFQYHDGKQNGRKQLGCRRRIYRTGGDR